MKDGLVWTEVMEAAVVGVMRQVQNLRDGRRDAHGAEIEDGWGCHIEGACGELLVAKAMNLHWPGVGSVRGPDVGGTIDVRTGRSHGSVLIIRRSDPDTRPFVLVTGRVPDLRVRGWILAGDGKRPEYIRDPKERGSAYFVPVDRLRDLTELRGYVANGGGK